MLYLTPLLLTIVSVPDPPRPALTPGTRPCVCENPERTPYFLHVPPDFDTNWPTPLIFVLSDDKEALRKTGWAAQADRCGFVTVAFASPTPPTADEVGRILDDVGNKVTLDPARLYLAIEGRALLPPSSVERFAAVSVYTDSKEALPLPSGIAQEVRDGKRDTQAVWVFFDQNPRWAGTPVPTTLTVTCTGLRNDKGQVLVSLYNRSDGFPDGATPLRTLAVPPTGGLATARFTDLPPGDYACVFVHDENNNEKIDTRLGIPQEGFGTSNNPKVRFGPPRYSDARLHLPGDRPERRILLRAIYL